MKSSALLNPSYGNFFPALNLPLYPKWREVDLDSGGDESGHGGGDYGQAPKVGDPLGPGDAWRRLAPPFCRGRNGTYFKGMYMSEEGIHFVVGMIVDAHNHQRLQSVI